MGAGFPAAAQDGEKRDSVGEDAIDAVTQPLSDFGLRSKDIPMILLLAQDAPYSLADLTDCAAFRGEVARLDEVLAPDVDAEPEEDGLLNQGLKTGGSILGGLIPFRGLVRQISGAKAHEGRWDTAIYAGVARRSFLKGHMQATNCETEEAESIRTARDVLGLTPQIEGQPEG